MTTESSFWTDARIAQLKDMVGRGLRGPQIGRALGCSRSAALSKANRLGIRIPSSPAFKPRPTAAQRPSALPLTAPKPPTAVREIVFAALPGSLPVAFGTPRVCKWPIDGFAEPMCCGRRVTSPKSPYCDDHHALAFGTNDAA